MLMARGVITSYAELPCLVYHSPLTERLGNSAYRTTTVPGNGKHRRRHSMSGQRSTENGVGHKAVRFANEGLLDDERQRPMYKRIILEGHSRRDAAACCPARLAHDRIVSGNFRFGRLKVDTGS